MRLQAIRTGWVADLRELDLVICACGYESRATHVAKQVAAQGGKRVALGFDKQQALNYEANRVWFEQSGYEVVDVDDDAFSVRLRSILDSSLVNLDHSPRVAVDISCLNRSRMARLVSELKNMSVPTMDVFFAYCVAKYSPPSSDLSATSIVEPVTPEFAGWTTNPDRPPAAVLGLGYEESRAIGIVDHLEINSAVWAFVPVGPISDYSASVDAANKSLYAMIGVDGRQLPYDIMDPASLFRELNSLVDLLKSRFNPIIVPFGPKIFALVAMLVASVQPEIGVWRVSSGLHEKPSDREPSEHITLLHVRYELD